MKRQLLDMKAESFVCWSIRDWTRATQVICHLLMGLINGQRVEAGWGGGWGGVGGLLTAHSHQIHTAAFRMTALARLFFFSQEWVLYFTDRLLLLLNAEKSMSLFIYLFI